jgi:hypothetical protein
MDPKAGREQIGEPSNAEITRELSVSEGVGFVVNSYPFHLVLT